MHTLNISFLYQCCLHYLGRSVWITDSSQWPSDVNHWTTVWAWRDKSMCVNTYVATATYVHTYVDAIYVVISSVREYVYYIHMYVIYTYVAMWKFSSIIKFMDSMVNISSTFYLVWIQGSCVYLCMYICKNWPFLHN